LDGKHEAGRAGADDEDIRIHMFCPAREKARIEDSTAPASYERGGGFASDQACETSQSRTCRALSDNSRFFGQAT
jgi:hypothetical protein